MAQYGHNETNVENCTFIQQLLRVGTVAASPLLYYSHYVL